MTKIVHTGTSKVYELLPLEQFTQLAKAFPSVFKGLRRRDA